MAVPPASNKRRWRWWVRVIVAGILLLLAMSFTAPSASATQTRSMVDRPDDFNGYQIHFIYVVPADGSDNNWDTNGRIKTWIDAGQAWLQVKINRQLIVDSSSQEYDITFFKSKYTVAEMKTLEGTTLLNDLTNEIAPVIGTSPNPKTYLYVIDGDVSSTYCGRGQTYSNQGMFYGAPLCLNVDSNDYSTSFYGLRFISSSILHEYFHTLGVSHTCYNNSDLMIGVPECLSTANPKLTSPLTIDIARQYYFGGNKSGADISQMAIWKGGSESSAATEWVQKESYSYAGTRDGTMFAVVGQTTPGFYWTFTQTNVFGWIATLSTASCTITYKEVMVPGTFTGGKCIFDIPTTWRVGKEFIVHADIKSGPFWAKTTAAGVLLRSDYSKSTCTDDFCFTNETWSPRNYHWNADSMGSVWLQELVNDEWKTLETSKLVAKTDGGVTYLTSEFAPLTFASAGLRTVRQYIPASASYGEYIGAPSTLIVLESTAVEPTLAEISDAKLQSEKAVQEFEARKAAAVLAEQKRVAEAAAKLKADKAAAAKGKITCVKGKSTKIVKGTKCPSGYTKKK